jgi:protein-S-isoprenylcysteine O-methyltransferase Ste14
MVRVRRIGLVIAGTLLAAGLVAALATEGLWLALLVAIAALVMAMFVIPVIAIFEEEHELPLAQRSDYRRR